jgi:hypothetical protein
MGSWTWQNRNPQAWHFAASATVLMVAFASYLLAASIKCRCHFSVWHNAQAQAGLAFVAMAFARMLLAFKQRDTRFHWKLYVALTVLSPLWIAGVFQTVLAWRDWWLI